MHELVATPHLFAAPAAEPILKADAKEHLRVDSAFITDDDYIDLLIAAAREHVESYTRRAVITQTWDIKWDRFPWSSGEWLELMKPPTQSVTSVSYTDTAGDSQTWSSALYDTDLVSGPKAVHSRLMPAFGEVWPSTQRELNAVTIRIVAGYGDAGTDAPTALLQAMKLLIGHWYETRVAVVIETITAEVPQAVDALLWPYRAITF